MAFLNLLLLLSLSLGGAQLAVATPARPLLMPGKQSLYQRVLVKPGTTIFAGAKQGKGEITIPFTAYYVYARQEYSGSSWLQLGLNRHGEIAGWVPEENLLPWNQGLTVAFRDPLDNDRVLLFRDKEAIKSLLESQDPDAYRKLYQSAVDGKLGADSPVVAIQPKAYLDILKEFYLVPIRDHEDIYLGSEQARILRVSSVPLQPLNETATKPGDKPPEPMRPTKHFRSGVVFVIDSTLSMDPYIDRTREAVRKIYDTITKEDLGGDVSFGLIAFRDNQQVTPGLEYLTRTFVDLKQGRDANTFLRQVSSLKAATVSSRGFIEDSYAGVQEAINGIDWEGQDARYVVLITDAGPRDAYDPLSGTGMSSETLRRLAQDKGIVLSVLHLLIPRLHANFERAEKRYRDLSYYPDIGSFYFGVEMGDVDRFGRVLDAMAQQITDQVKVAAVSGSVESAPPKSEAVPVVEQDETPDQLARFQTKLAKLGYALRMRYLQRGEGQQMPSVFDAWLIDRDFNHPERRTLDIRVLLTRDQLSDLHSIMRQVLETAEEGLLSPRNFLNDLKSLSATIARDPGRLGSTTRVTSSHEGNLADMGFMREYIGNLPYTGEIMSLSLEDWQDWPVQSQVDFLHRLEEKINYYQVLHDHTDLWVSLDGGPISGNSVFPIALEMLP